jgi:hypothetical protein
MQRWKRILFVALASILTVVLFEALLYVLAVLLWPNF